MKKLIRVFKYICSGFAFIYGVVLVFPQILFSNIYEYKNFSIYYHSENMNIPKLESVLDKSIELLSAADAFEVEKKQKIFLCDSFGEFAFFAPKSRKAFAVNYPLIQNIFLSKSNVLENSVRRNDAEYNKRTLSGVIAHETAHSLLENRLGFLKYKILPSWKNEGYCDYVANESSYDEKLGLKQFCENKNVDSRSYAYYQHKIYVEYLLKQENNTIDDFLAIDFNLDKLAFRLRKKYCSNP